MHCKMYKYKYVCIYALKILLSITESDSDRTEHSDAGRE